MAQLFGSDLTRILVVGGGLIALSPQALAQDPGVIGRLPPDLARALTRQFAPPPPDFRPLMHGNDPGFGLARRRAALINQSTLAQACGLGGAPITDTIAQGAVDQIGVGLSQAGIDITGALRTIHESFVDPRTGVKSYEASIGLAEDGRPVPIGTRARFLLVVRTAHLIKFPNDDVTQPPVDNIFVTVEAHDVDLGVVVQTVAPRSGNLQGIPSDATVAAQVAGALRRMGVSDGAVTGGRGEGGTGITLTEWLRLGEKDDIKPTKMPVEVAKSERRLRKRPGGLAPVCKPPRSTSAASPVPPSTTVGPTNLPPQAQMEVLPGGYVGIEILKNTGTLKSTEKLAATGVVTNQFNDSNDPIGFGVITGYDFAPWSNRVVLGAFASFDALNQTVKHSFAGGTFLGTTTHWIATLGGKVGYQISANAQVYALGSPVTKSLFDQSTPVVATTASMANCPSISAMMTMAIAIATSV